MDFQQNNMRNRFEKGEVSVRKKNEFALIDLHLCHNNFDYYKNR
jgi:hypothetical protein